MGYLAYSIAFFNDMPVEVYPYDTELIQLIFVACKVRRETTPFIFFACLKETRFSSFFWY